MIFDQHLMYEHSCTRLDENDTQTESNAYIKPLETSSCGEGISNIRVRAVT